MTYVPVYLPFLTQALPIYEWAPKIIYELESFAYKHGCKRSLKFQHSPSFWEAIFERLIAPRESERERGHKIIEILKKIHTFS